MSKCPCGGRLWNSHTPPELSIVPFYRYKVCQDCGFRWGVKG